MSDDLPAIQNEIAAIEATMGTPAYTRDETAQARYRELIRSRDGIGEATILTGNELAPRTPAEYARINGDGPGYTEYLRAMREYADIFTHVADPEGFNAKLEALPDAVTDALIVELVSDTMPPDPIDDATLAQLSREPGTHRLAREWGHEARHRFGIVRARLWRAIGMMGSEADFDRFDAFLMGLEPDETEAVFRKLAA